MEYTFFGIVQGVGFRYTAYHLANSLGLTGFVKNNSDGSVTMQIQGAEHSISKCINGIHNAPFIEVSDFESKKLPVLDYERSFYIKNSY